MDHMRFPQTSQPKPTGEIIQLVAKDGSKIDLKPVLLAKYDSFTIIGYVKIQRWIKVPEKVPVFAPERIEFGKVDPTRGADTILVKLVPEKDLWTAKLTSKFNLSSRPAEGFEPLAGKKLPKPEKGPEGAYHLRLPEPLPAGTYGLVSDAEAWVFKVEEPAAVHPTID